MQQIGRGQELKFTVEVFVRPDVKLGAYKNLGIKKEPAEVTDDDVSAEIERARERAARYVEVTDRPAKLDDQVNIDYAGYLGDVQFDGGTATGHDLVLGSGSFIPGFEDQLVGAKVGDEVGRQRHLPRGVPRARTRRQGGRVQGGRSTPSAKRTSPPSTTTS